MIKQGTRFCRQSESENGRISLRDCFYYIIVGLYTSFLVRLHSVCVLCCVVLCCVVLC
jgi:hypothetical protein